VAVASAGPDASLHLAPDRQPRQHPTAQVFKGQMPFLLPNQQCQSTEESNHAKIVDTIFLTTAKSPISILHL